MYIDTQDALEDLCQVLMMQPYITVDTEFLRERTYWPQLCLIQIGWHANCEVCSALIDPQAEICLRPLYDVFRIPSVLKVFHAARQDIEIFHHLQGVIPHPLFDTQIASMVCGYGEQVSYSALVQRTCDVALDKSSRITNWAQRPLSEKQKAYARADVTHLCAVYEAISEQLAQNQRHSWLNEEMAILYDPATYTTDPSRAWERIKTRNMPTKSLPVLAELAKWREEEAQVRDLAKGRLLKDDVLVDLATLRPKTLEEMKASRAMQRASLPKGLEDNVFAAIARGLEIPVESIPHPPKGTVLNAQQRLQKELLKVFLSVRAHELGVAERLIASSADLTQFVVTHGDEPLQGWRKELFGDEALALLNGQRSLMIEGDNVVMTSV